MLTFGTAMNPCTKDQDRIDYRKINVGQFTTYLFGLFDGHGLSSAASDSVELNLLNFLEEEWNWIQPHQCGLSFPNNDLLHVPNHLKAKNLPFYRIYSEAAAFMKYSLATFIDLLDCA